MVVILTLFYSCIAFIISGLLMYSLLLGEKFYKELRSLTLMFCIYELRKLYMDELNLSYESKFEFVLEGLPINIEFESENLSQKEIIAKMYSKIYIIDNLISKLSKHSIKIDLNSFYNLRYKVRTERLFYENKT